ncbi:vasotocin-neurophysin VT-like, partial [Geospiza fortis]|uniref:Vasotocin-neurophysin VT-like n=1 Tax=Geospiza fortis TaxID=48883 RepID=A0A8N5EWK9_GEOFO
PRGGKRALADTALRQCLPCGPGNRGSCFGPGICCGTELGCYLGTAETRRCACCTAETCTMDSACLDEGGEGAQEAAEEKNLTLLDGSAGDLLLKLMHLANRQQQQQGKHPLL